MSKNVFSVTVTGLEEEIELVLRNIEQDKRILKRHEEILKHLNWLRQFTPEMKRLEEEEEIGG